MTPLKYCRLSSQEKEIKDLLIRLGKADQERSALTHQVRVFYTVAVVTSADGSGCGQVTHMYSQATVLASETDQSRKTRIAELFPPVHYVEESFASQPLNISDPSRFIAALPEVGGPGVSLLAFGSSLSTEI
jgi:hypothetical protein